MYDGRRPTSPARGADVRSFIYTTRTHCLRLNPLSTCLGRAESPCHSCQSACRCLQSPPALPGSSLHRASASAAPCLPACMHVIPTPARAVICRWGAACHRRERASCVLARDAVGMASRIVRWSRCFRFCMGWSTSTMLSASFEGRRASAPVAWDVAFLSTLGLLLLTEKRSMLDLRCVVSMKMKKVAAIRGHG